MIRNSTLYTVTDEKQKRLSYHESLSRKTGHPGPVVVFLLRMFGRMFHYALRWKRHPCLQPSETAAKTGLENRRGRVEWWFSRFSLAASHPEICKIQGWVSLHDFGCIFFALLTGRRKRKTCQSGRMNYKFDFRNIKFHVSPGRALVSIIRGNDMQICLF